MNSISKGINIGMRPKTKHDDTAADKSRPSVRGVARADVARRDLSCDDSDEGDEHFVLPMELSAANEVSIPVKAAQKRKQGMVGCIFPLCVIFWLLVVVVWDMNKVQQLSTVIHNDHSSLWMYMNESMISSLYSPMSLCILDAPASTLNTVEIRNSCAELNKKDRFPFCTVGYSLNKECLGSLLSEDSYYFKVLRDPYYHSAHDKLLDALEQLAAAGWSLVFAGDKISLQSMNALICALDNHPSARFQIQQNSAYNFTLKWKSSIMQVEIFFQTLRAIKYSTNDDIHLSGEAINTFNRNNGSLTTLEITQEKVSDQLMRYKGVVVVANVGSYYNSRVSYREDMPELMKYLNEIGKHNIAVFRESASQHWNLTRSGYYFVQNLKKDGRVEPVSCQPNLDSSPNLDWRNRDAESTMTTYSLDNIDWINFHDITAPLYSMHPYGLNSSSPADVDCTQYCYFPQMWQPLWMQLHSIIDRNSKLSARRLRRNR